MTVLLSFLCTLNFLSKSLLYQLSPPNSESTYQYYRPSNGHLQLCRSYRDLPFHILYSKYPFSLNI